MVINFGDETSEWVNYDVHVLVVKIWVDFGPHYSASLREMMFQNGLMRCPRPSGENGLTLAHISASLREIAEVPSSKKKAGPCKENDKM